MRMRPMGGATSRAEVTRRDVIGTSLGMLALTVVRPALGSPAELEAAIRAFVGEAPVQEGRVTLDIPPLAENGNSVPLTVTVDSPMTEEDFVRRIAIFNEKNPQPQVAQFQLGPRAGRATISTRMRLATSQQVTAIAELSDGSFWADRGNVIVTLAACVES
jgi:sulfur-oxidizing protein SoxY